MTCDDQSREAVAFEGRLKLTLMGLAPALPFAPDLWWNLQVDRVIDGLYALC